MEKRLNELGKEIHQNAINKGFWDKDPEIGTLLMLVVSELGEALEADRKDYWSNISDYGFDESADSFSEAFENDVKNTFEDEIADSIIRLLDICAANNIDIERHIELKMKYNETREKLHGKKY